jgi:hypothetical protein
VSFLAAGASVREVILYGGYGSVEPRHISNRFLFSRAVFFFDS